MFLAGGRVGGGQAILLVAAVEAAALNLEGWPFSAPTHIWVLGAQPLVDNAGGIESMIQFLCVKDSLQEAWTNQIPICFRLNNFRWLSDWHLRVVPADQPSRKFTSKMDFWPQWCLKIKAKWGRSTYYLFWKPSKSSQERGILHPFRPTMTTVERSSGFVILCQTTQKLYFYTPKPNIFSLPWKFKSSGKIPALHFIKKHFSPEMPSEERLSLHLASSSWFPSALCLVTALPARAGHRTARGQGTEDPAGRCLPQVLHPCLLRPSICTPCLGIPLHGLSLAVVPGRCLKDAK